MGRSAGGSGGGSSGGGGRSSSGSHRTSYGHSHSSSSRSARSSLSSSFSGGSSRSSRRSYDNDSYSYGGSSYGGSGRYRRSFYHDVVGYRPYRQTPVMTVMLQFIVIMIVVFMLGSIMYSRNSAQVPNSTIEREVLDKSKVVVSDYYDDRLNWFVSGTKVKNGMKYFFDKTGVQPYLVIDDNIEGDSNPTADEMDTYLNKLYKQLFKDEQHIILLYFDNGSRWETRLLCGISAQVVMDSEASEILLSYVDYYATSDMEDDDYFNTVFRKSADKIMTVSTNKYDVLKVLVYASCLITSLVLLVVARKIKFKSLKKQEELLNTPLVDPLLNKYEKENENG